VKLRQTTVQLVRGQDSTMWDIVWVSPQGHRSESVRRQVFLQAPQCPWPVRKRFRRDHCCRARVKPVKTYLNYGVIVVLHQHVVCRWRRKVMRSVQHWSLDSSRSTWTPWSTSCFSRSWLACVRRRTSCWWNCRATSLSPASFHSAKVLWVSKTFWRAWT